MGDAIKTHLIRMGNFRGVQIPKDWLEQLDLGDEVELAINANQIVIRSARRPRRGWDDRFRVMHEQANDRLVDSFPALAWDVDEWQW